MEKSEAEEAHAAIMRFERRLAAMHQAEPEIVKLSHDGDDDAAPQLTVEDHGTEG